MASSSPPRSTYALLVALLGLAVVLQACNSGADTGPTQLAHDPPPANASVQPDAVDEAPGGRDKQLNDVDETDNPADDGRDEKDVDETDDPADDRHGEVGVARATPVDAVSQHGITWTFDGDHPVGRYANGDYWVEGPVRIVDIDPASERQSNRTINGSMINPSPRDGIRTGYGETRDTGYDPTKNVADGVSASSPLVVQPGSSLVSTISTEEANARPGIHTAAVLTVVEEPPPERAFRPSYSGTDKASAFTTDQLRYDLLPRLPAVSGTPDIDAMARNFERVWLDHVPGWTGRAIHPVTSMPAYGRDLASRFGEGSLLLLVDRSSAQKEELLINQVQIGIDLYGIVEDGGEESWVPNGGHAQGRKWPILFAGTMLDDDAMSAIGQRGDVFFGEDAQTFYVTQEDIDRPRPSGVPSYTAEDLGMPEWGIRHATDPESDTPDWNATYRQCCTGNSWGGYVLAAHLMGLRGAWNHEALFDYTDRYIDRQPQGDWTRFYDRPFAENMWDAYRELDPAEVPLPGPDDGPLQDEVARLSGPDRYATAASIARHVFPTGADRVLLASGEAFPDGLSAAPVAMRLGAPIVLTARDHLPTDTRAVLADLGPAEIVVVGGSAAVSEHVVREVEGLIDAVDIRRIGGAERIDTANRVVAHAWPDGAATVYVATAVGFADALAGGAAAGHEDAPMLLSGRDAITPDTMALIAALAPAEVVLLGGEGALSQGVQRQVSQVVPRVTRIAGADRIATAAQLAERFGSFRSAWLVTAYAFPDAIGAGAAAATEGAPLLMVPPPDVANSLPALTAERLASELPSRLVVVGGTAAVSDQVAAEAAGAAGHSR